MIEIRAPRISRRSMLFCASAARSTSWPRFFGSLKKIDPPVMLALAGKDAQNSLGDHGLAGAALADDRQRAVRLHVQRHPGHGLDLALVGLEPDAQITDRQQRLDHRPSSNNEAAVASVARG